MPRHVRVLRFVETYWSSLRDFSHALSVQLLLRCHFYHRNLLSFYQTNISRNKRHLKGSGNLTVRIGVAKLNPKIMSILQTQIFKQKWLGKRISVFDWIISYLGSSNFMRLKCCLWTFHQWATILTSFILVLSPLVDESSPVITGFQKTFP